jgi:hypothetical protein
MHEPLSPNGVRQAALIVPVLKISPQSLNSNLSRTNIGATVPHPPMLGVFPVIPNADSMNGGILRLMCEISHQAVTSITPKWLKAEAFHLGFAPGIHCTPQGTAALPSPYHLVQAF